MPDFNRAAFISACRTPEAVALFDTLVAEIAFAAWTVLEMNGSVGFVPKADHERRIAEKDARIAELESIVNSNGGQTSHQRTDQIADGPNAKPADLPAPPIPDRQAGPVPINGCIRCGGGTDAIYRCRRDDCPCIGTLRKAAGR
jgi:hypothetical protein